jgi:hypothetical protein
MIFWIEVDSKVLKELLLEEGAERGNGRKGVEVLGC